MTFKNALPNDLKNVFYEGKQALKGEHRACVSCQPSHQFSGSIDLDAALKSHPKHKNANRWDYGLGLKQTGMPEEGVFWIEVHHASKSGEMLAKIRWLKNWLANEAPELKIITKRFCWMATSAGGTPQHHLRELQNEGLKMPRQYLVLP